MQGRAAHTIIPVFAASTRVHSGVSVFEVLQLLELWISQPKLVQAVESCLALHYLPGGDARKSPLTGWELGTPLVLQRFADLLGPTRVITVLEALEGPFQTEYRVIAASFGVSSLKYCSQCGAWLYLRSACLACGFSCAHQDLQNNILLVEPDSSAVNYHVDWDLLEQARQRVIISSIDYLDKCTHDAGVFDMFGGDIIFLFRNLVQYAGGKSIQTCHFLLRDSGTLSSKLANHLHSLIKNWIEQNISMSIEIEMEEILNTVEALHVLAQLDITDDNIPPPKQIAQRLTRVQTDVKFSTKFSESSKPTTNLPRANMKNVRHSREMRGGEASGA
mmetsp:Transcript_32212/g.99649  ORF Transcript_32212/g.99649 Transcript_32212/m.99649 type:complete len:333 (-) Transcript_32212:1126-2124(-)